jgi:hypothetical protein
MLTKILTTTPHWIDLDLFVNKPLTDKEQSDQKSLIITNLQNYLVPRISVNDQYTLVVNLYLSNDNVYLYYLIADLHVYPIQKMTRSARTTRISTDRQAVSNEPLLGISAMATQHNPPPPPPPPPLLINTSFHEFRRIFNQVGNSLIIGGPGEAMGERITERIGERIGEGTGERV